jgi:DNA primase
MIAEQKQILHRILGRGKTLNNGEQIIFVCPFCHHHKPKLQVHLELGHYHCWVCGVKGRTIVTLLKKLKIDNETINKFRTNKNNVLLNQKPGTQETINKELVTLPKEFKPLYLKRDDPDYKHAIRYLINRGLTVQDILKYNIGYCDKGPYSGMIIIPSYDMNGQLNFFVGRSYYPDATIRHKNPMVSKNIIGFELFINWKLPVVIVEGVFDAIAVKRNAIPLFGKKIMSKLKEKILLEKVKTIYICLDRDARQDSIKISEYFSNHGVTVHYVDLQEKDPSEIGFNKIQTILLETKTFDFGDMIKLKLAL